MSQEEILKLLAEANEHCSRKEYDNAISKLSGALEKEPGNTEIGAALGNAYTEKISYLQKEKKFDDVFDALKESVKAGVKTRKQAEEDLGRIVDEEKAVDGFVASYIEYLDKIKPDKSFYRFIWDLPLKKENYRKLRDVFDKAIRKYPDDPEYHRHAGIVEWNLENYAKATIHFEKVVADEGYNHDDIYYLCESYDRIRQPAKVIKAVSKAIDDDPGNGRYYFSLWNYFWKYDKIKNAVSFYKNATESNPDVGAAYSCYGYALQMDSRFEEAEKAMEKAIELSKDIAVDYYDLGNVYLYSYQYGKAINQFSRALAARSEENSHAFARHNVAFIYEKLGDYKRARQEWAETIKCYEREIKKPDNRSYDIAQLNFYCARIYLFSFYDFEAEKIETFLNNALAMAPGVPQLRLLMVKYYKEKKQSYSEKGGQNEEERNSKINEAHIKILEHLRAGTFLAQKALDNFANKFNYSDLGEFYLEQDKPEEAKRNFKKALELDENFLAGYIGMGVAQVKSGEFRDAIKSFKISLDIDPDNLHIQNNLGEAYRKSEMYDLAEDAYRRILAISPYHVDALAGLGECYSMRGDKAIEQKNINAAEEYFSSARDQFAKALAQGGPTASRRLNKTEKSTLYYSLGYVKVKLAEMKKGFDFLMLRGAERDFEQIQETQPEYFKASKALKKIREYKYSFLSIRRNAPRIIFWLSLLIFFGALYMFIFSRFEKKDKYTLNTNELIYLLRQQKSDSLKARFSLLDSLEFQSAKSLEDKIRTIAPPGFLTADIRNKIIDHEEIKGKDKMTEVTFVFFVFGSLIFMVIGLFLTDITRLKVGSIEMDKNAVDNVSTTPSLGIGK